MWLKREKYDELVYEFKYLKSKYDDLYKTVDAIKTDKVDKIAISEVIKDGILSYVDYILTNDKTKLDENELLTYKINWYTERLDSIPNIQKLKSELTQILSKLNEKYILDKLNDGLFINQIVDELNKKQIK